MNGVHRSILAVSVLSLAGFSLVDTGRGEPQQKAGHEERMACPSADFTTFFHEFSEKTDMQERFTRFPLHYGKVDITSDGEPFIEEKIDSYDKIPTRNHDNGLIFPDEKERTIGRRPGTELHFSMQYGFTDDFRDAPAISDIEGNSTAATVVLYAEESDFQVYYRFIKERNCWFLGEN